MKRRSKLGSLILHHIQSRTQRSRVGGRSSRQRVKPGWVSSRLESSVRTPLKRSDRPLTHPLRISLMQPSRAPEAPKQAIDPATKQISSAPEIAETVQLPLALPPVVMPTPPAERQSPSEVHHLSTFELIRPQERLKQSIEGFLLDQRSEHTRRAYGRDLKRFLMFLSARNFQQGPSELNRTVLIAYKESLLTEKLEHTTVDRHLATLKSFFNWLVDDGILLRSPAHGVRFLSPKRLSKTIGFSDEEVKKVLAMPNLHTRTGSLHYAVLMVLFYCGLRRSEACSLRTTHFGTEREQRVLRLMGKGNKERIIVVIPAVWSALVHYFRITRREFSEPQALFMPIRNNRTQEVKKAIDPSMVFYIVTKYAKLAGIANRVSPHSCRATAISNARDHHVPDRAIQEFAGWASPDMITRYDKRRSSIEDSAAHAISYGAEARILPESSEPS